MTKAFVLMTAMPPTIGHMNLIRFAKGLNLDDEVRVIVCTQPGEPFSGERYEAILNAVEKIDSMFHDVDVFHLHRTLEQDPSAEGFWPMWKEIMTSYGAKDGDVYVTSEPYGKTMAEVMNGKFMPFDIAREFEYSKATLIRENPWGNFSSILPEFRQHLRAKITIFGAESTGKTTLAKAIAATLPDAQWLFEYARPYLENVGPEVTREAMNDIWHGQHSLQVLADSEATAPVVIQDTDLFSTIGYWEQPHQQEKLGTVPVGLVGEAYSKISDLYLITSSNIPFEKDPIRYGDGVRESPDEFWIDVAERLGLPYVVLTDETLHDRLSSALVEIEKVRENLAERIRYDRKGF